MNRQDFHTNAPARSDRGSFASRRGRSGRPARDGYRDNTVERAGECSHHRHHDRKGHPNRDLHESREQSFGAKPHRSRRPDHSRHVESGHVTRAGHKGMGHDTERRDTEHRHYECRSGEHFGGERRRIMQMRRWQRAYANGFAAGYARGMNAA